jgi:hypothetical protein
MIYPNSPPYLALQLLHELCLSLLSLLVGGELALVAAVLLIQLAAQLNVLLHQRLGVRVLTTRLSLLQLQGLLQLWTDKEGRWSGMVVGDGEVLIQNIVLVGKGEDNRLWG